MQVRVNYVLRVSSVLCLHVAYKEFGRNPLKNTFLVYFINSENARRSTNDCVLGLQWETSIDEFMANKMCECFLCTICTDFINNARTIQIRGGDIAIIKCIPTFLKNHRFLLNLFSFVNFFNVDQPIYTSFCSYFPYSKAKSSLNLSIPKHLLERKNSNIQIDIRVRLKKIYIYFEPYESTNFINTMIYFDKFYTPNIFFPRFFFQ